ncbi:MAG: hypothetical protein JSW34_03090 [Candidatus Zixiibacteriota bacterium]|nr:MAG: hypothetical protein JSW34_03090 [candidate division Zixibacteria bacterium]
MFRKTISLVTLTALTIYTFGASGCTKVVTRPGWKIRVTEPVKVTGLKLTSGETVAFDSTGAAYHSKQAIFSGTSSDATSRSIRLDAVDSVYYTKTLDSTVRSASAEWFGRYQSDERQRSDRQKADVGQIITVFTPDTTIWFKEKTGRIDIPNHAVVGISQDGNAVRIPINEVDSLTTARPQGQGLASKLILGAAVIGVAALIVVMIKSFPGESGEGFPIFGE